VVTQIRWIAWSTSIPHNRTVWSLLPVARVCPSGLDATAVGSRRGCLPLPATRKSAGPLCSTHAWLRPGDWNYAFCSHFDFVVHEGLDGKHPTHPLFAVEFDGSSWHSTPDARRRDQRKNRLCLASGLPLVRINDTFLQCREQLQLSLIG
jgi:hypothetical protein